MAEARCALAMLPAENGDRERLVASLEAAMATGQGDLAEIVVLPDSPTGGAAGDVLRAAAREALECGFDWLLAVSAAETLLPDIFVKMTPALRLHDVIWGGATTIAEPGAAPRFHRPTRLAAQDLPSFFHAALAWWIGPTHFVRPAGALAALHSTAMAGWYADYMMRLWTSGGAYKTAQALTAFHGDVPMLADADRQRLIVSLERAPVFMPVRYGAMTLKLPYTGLNPVIEREQMRGLFFEHDELACLAERLPRGLRIADIGANTGNHTLFFAAVLEAAAVIPVEPSPRAVAAIRSVVVENGLKNVDLTRLGRAVGAEVGMMTPVPSLTAGLGAMHFVADRQGSVPVVPLDHLITDPVDFIKIDVEGMEMATLAGAQRLVAQSRPIILIEVVDDIVGAFVAWADANRYRVEKLFPDKTHCNYLLSPAD